jgi:UDP-N-acetylmuramoyl-L-alanyl-D-glutamate--2,6-diaminopimelate ligase
MNQAALSWLQSRPTSAQLVSDSRRVEPGDIFLAYPGDKNDGRRYISDAIERGAVAVMFDAQDYTASPEWNVSCYGLPQLKQQAGQLAAAYYERPSQNMTVLAVTGTNGKTTCAWWLAQALNRLGQRSALIGTLGSGFVDQLRPTGYTTPDAVLLQRQLRELRERVAVMIVHLQVRRALRDTLPTTGHAQDLRTCPGHLGALPAGGFLVGAGGEHRAG